MKAKLKVKEIEHLYTYYILDISKLRVFCFFPFLLSLIHAQKNPLYVNTETITGRNCKNP